MPVEVAFDRFADHVALQALIITQRGRDHEAPLGIITTWDVATYPAA